MPNSETLRRIAGASVIAAFFSATSVQAEKSPNVLYRFKGAPDGAVSFAPLIEFDGNFYGTTSVGGTGTDCEFGEGCGTIFRITPEGKERVLYSFKGGCDGAFPWAGLVADSAGNYYGTTTEGGDCDSSGEGTVFKLAADGRASVLYAFQGGSDGGNPLGGVILDNEGNLYGTTSVGGGGDCGCGVVFEITADGTEKTLYAFKGGSDGMEPYSGLVRDAQGNLYGTTVFGGDGQDPECGGVGCGTVFKLTPDGTETVLYAFQGSSDGRAPRGDLILDKSGNLYGTAGGGGASDNGAVFRLAPDGAETVLYSFKAGSDGRAPDAGVVMDKMGNLYGTTFAGGNLSSCKSYGGCGLVFKLTPKGKETILLTFDGKNGGNPNAGLLLGKNGMLYGTTSRGGHHNNGVVFQVKK